MRIIFSIQATVEGPIYFIWNTERRLPELYESQKTNRFEKGYQGNWGTEGNWELKDFGLINQKKKQMGLWLS